MIGQRQTAAPPRGEIGTEMADSWAEGMPVDVYVAQLWRKHRDRFARNRERTVVPDDLRARFGSRPRRLLVLTEPYCEDSAQFVPIVWRLAQETQGVELRVLRPSEHRDLADRYPTVGGHPAIPVFVVLDEGLREVGALVERPGRATAEMAAEARRFQREHADLPGIRRTLERMPDGTRATVKRHIAAWRDAQHDRWTRYLLEDLLTICEGSADRRAPTRA